MSWKFPVGDNGCWDFGWRVVLVDMGSVLECHWLIIGLLCRCVSGEQVLDLINSIWSVVDW